MATYLYSGRYLVFGAVSLAWLLLSVIAYGDDLAQLKERGVLRHMGVLYGNFVTGSGDGLDTDIVKMFADSLGVKYQFIETNFEAAVGDLIGREIKLKDGEATLGEKIPIRGDLIASGFTVLPWREDVASFSDPVFPTGIWVMARADSAAQPVQPSGKVERDIERVRSMLKDRSVLGQKDSCLDPVLYDLDQTGAQVKLFDPARNLNEMVPAMLNGEAELTLADAPDALIALEKWPGEVKVIGPLTPRQALAVVFRKDDTQLREAFNQFLKKLKADGTYVKLIRKYYPSIFFFYEEYFEGMANGEQADSAARIVRDVSDSARSADNPLQN
jgi:hypothetical protein